MPKKSAIKVVQSATEEVTTEILATAIRDIAEGIRKFRKGPGTLTDRALFVLIRDAAPNNISMGAIRDVFDGIEKLEQYVRSDTFKRINGNGG